MFCNTVCVYVSLTNAYLHEDELLYNSLIYIVLANSYLLLAVLGTHSHAKPCLTFYLASIVNYKQMHPVSN